MAENQANTEDVLLVERIRNGDKMAESLLDKKYRPRVLFLAMSKLKNNEEAEDICQETMTVVFTAINSNRIREPEKLSSYILTICRRKIIDHIKKKKRRIEEVDLNENEIKDPSKANGFIDEGFGDEATAALEKLSEREQSIIYLTYVFGWSGQEISRVLRITPDYVRKIKQRAIKKLLKILKKNVTD
ncbi:MAG: sigma-70 family RNA polymerase sigma factor [Candidatus Lokiarchaeota archaeon]|nr:sigma-70 family RNA polymerase sigma factor [Candidatus Lokiarchaeota archaeon]